MQHCCPVRLISFLLYHCLLWTGALFPLSIPDLSNSKGKWLFQFKSCVWVTVDLVGLAHSQNGANIYPCFLIMKQRDTFTIYSSLKSTLSSPSNIFHFVDIYCMLLILKSFGLGGLYRWTSHKQHFLLLEKSCLGFQDLHGGSKLPVTAV